MSTTENGVLIGLDYFVLFVACVLLFLCKNMCAQRNQARRVSQEYFISKLSRMTTSHLLDTVLQFYYTEV